MRDVFYLIIFGVLVFSFCVEAANDAQFVRQSLHSAMALGSSYNVSVVMKNTGTTTWTAAQGYRLGSQNPPDNVNWGVARAYLGPSDSIGPGQNKTFVFTVTPSASGSVVFQWRMLREGAEWFGEYTPCTNLVYSGDVLITSPYTAKTHVYTGQIHVHTNNSDGYQSPAAVVTGYRDAGYDFISVTDHSKITADPYVPGILFIPGIEETPKSPLRNYTYGNHMNRIGALTPSIYYLNSTPQTVIDQALSEGSFVFLNHPNWPGGYPANPNWNDAELDSVNGCYGIEVWNSLVVPNQNAENRADYLLSKNKRFYLTATDDCHNIISDRCKTASVRVFSDELTVSAIMDGLKSGNFYASNGANISGISIYEKTIEITTDAASDIEFIIKDGVVIQSHSDVLAANYTVAGNETYVRARVTRNSDNKTAWTNPLYVSNPAMISFIDPTPADDASAYSGSVVSVKTNASGGSSVLDWNSTLLAWWRFNDVEEESAEYFNDWSGYSHGASCNGSSCPADAAGKYGSALRFDGVDDCLISSSDYGDDTSTLTVAAWVYPASGGYALSFASKDDLSSGRSWYFGLNSNNSFKVALWTSEGRKDIIAYGLALNEWTHVAFTYNGSIISLYKNGVLAASGTVSGPIVKTSSSVTIGCIKDRYNFNGTIDDLYIHNRVLSADEIKAIYDARNPLSADFTLPEGDYSFQAYAQDYEGNTAETEKRTIHIIPCTDECEASGAIRCNGNGVQTCGNYDLDSCLEWSDTINCPTGLTCINGICVTTTSTTTTSTTIPPCLMPGNDPPCDTVSLSEVVSAINSWAAGGFDLMDVVDLINSWSDPWSYPPI